MIKRLLILLASFIATYGVWISQSTTLAIIFSIILGILIIVVFIALVFPGLGCAGVELWTIPSAIIIGTEALIIFIKLTVIGIL